TCGSRLTHCPVDPENQVARLESVGPRGQACGMFDRLISLLVVVGLVWNGFPTTMPHAGTLEAARGGDSARASQVAEHAGHASHGQPVAPADENALGAPCHDDGAR